MDLNQMAAAIKTGNRSVLPHLWEHTNRFIYHCLNRLERQNPANTERMVQMGLTHEDIEQEAYFIFLDAIEQYDPDKGYPFLNSVKYATMTRFFSLIGMRTKAQRSDPLPFAERLEKPIASEDGDIYISDLIPDKNAVIDFENSVDNIVRDNLKQEISDALSELDSEQTAAIDYFFFNGCQLQSCQKAGDFSKKELTANKNKALRKIRRTHGKRLLPYAEELGIIQRYCFHSSFYNFKNTWTSSTERAAIKLIEHKAKC